MLRSQCGRQRNESAITKRGKWTTAFWTGMAIAAFWDSCKLRSRSGSANGSALRNRQSCVTSCVWLPNTGAKQVSAVLSARKDTDCYRFLPQDLGAELPKVQQTALDALDDPDPDLKQGAVAALGRWGSSDAETALWEHLQNIHQDGAGREDSSAVAFGEGLLLAIAKGTNWICPPDKLARLAELAWTKGPMQQI